MASSTSSGPIISQNGFAAPAIMGSAGGYANLVGQKNAIAQATATKLFTVTVPNINCGAGGRVMVTSTTTAAGHIGDSTRSVEYFWSVTRNAGSVAVITISIVTGGTVIATSGAGGAYTLTSTLGASSVTGGATAVNTFDIQVTNTGSTTSTSAATFFAEVLNNMGVFPIGALSVPAPGVTIA